MKVQNLMVGDWFLFQGRTPKKVKVIGDYPDYVEFEDGSKVSVASCLPILLTKKILEKNGLYLHCRQIGEGYDKHRPTGYFLEDVAYLLELTLRPNGDIYWSINIGEYCILPLAFVHELQHAIRLCGIEKEIVI